MSSRHDMFAFAAMLERESAAIAELVGLLRRRYECTCGYHGYREDVALPAHVKCPRCGGVAVAIGDTERVQ